MKLLRLILTALALTTAAACNAGGITAPTPHGTEPAYQDEESPPGDSDPDNDGMMGSGAGKAGE